LAGLGKSHAEGQQASPVVRRDAGRVSPDLAEEDRMWWISSDWPRFAGTICRRGSCHLLCNGSPRQGVGIRRVLSVLGGWGLGDEWESEMAHNKIKRDCA
jgi:hypothetical protein